MKIVIAGAGGLIGREFALQLSNQHQVLALKHSDLDITDSKAVSRLILVERPALVINCAVLGVDACELEPAWAWEVNVTGAENLAKAAAGISAEFLHISTNYVFDGNLERGSFYTIKDIPTPITVYGTTKFAGEHAVSSASARNFIIRTSWVFGVGKVNFFSAAHDSLNAKKQFRAITDIWASPTCVRDLVSRVEEILTHQRYDTYHVVNNGICSYHGFALEAARILGISAYETTRLIEPVCASDIPQAAQRPRHTPLRCLVSEEIGLAPMRDWRAALRDYISGH